MVPILVVVMLGPDTRTLLEKVVGGPSYRPNISPVIVLIQNPGGSGTMLTTFSNPISVPFPNAAASSDTVPVTVKGGSRKVSPMLQMRRWPATLMMVDEFSA